MQSKITKYLKMKTEPVAVIMSNECPDNTIQFKMGK